MLMRRLGREGPEVGALGLGCMGMWGTYGPADDAESIDTIRAAVEAGITLLDTGDYYGMGHNELLVREALRELPRARAVLGVTFGEPRLPDGQYRGVRRRLFAAKMSLACRSTRLTRRKHRDHRSAEERHEPELTEAPCARASRLRERTQRWRILRRDHAPPLAITQLSSETQSRRDERRSNAAAAVCRRYVEIEQVGRVRWKHEPELREELGRPFRQPRVSHRPAVVPAHQRSMASGGATRELVALAE